MTADWRVTEGPLIGREPVFDLHDIELHADFYEPGGMGRWASARLTTATPTICESDGRLLGDQQGQLRIFSHQPSQAYTHMLGRLGTQFSLEGQRGLLARCRPDGFAVHLHLPKDEFADLLPLLTGATRARLVIEIERTLDQGLLDEQAHFWNDAADPLIRFNSFELLTTTQR